MAEPIDLTFGLSTPVGRSKHKFNQIRQVANLIELVLASAHRSRQPKRQIDRFSHFCTAHGRKSLYFTIATLSPKIAPSHGGSGPPHNSDFLGQDARGVLVEMFNCN